MGRLIKIILFVVLILNISAVIAFAKEEATYTVQAGDTVASIAEKYLVSPDALILVNRLGPFSLKPGQVLTIPKAGEVPVVVDNVAELPTQSVTAAGKNVECIESGDSAEIRIGGTTVIRIRGNLAGKTPIERAKIVAARLSEAGTEYQPDDVMPMFDSTGWYIAAKGNHIINIDMASVRANNLSEGELTFAWANNIRRALGVEPMMLDSLSEATKASFYWQCSHTANGEVYYPDGISAAHRSLPFGTMVLVSDLETRKSVIVRINDRGPFIDGRLIDLSRGAAIKINRLSKGVFDVKMHVLRFDRD